MCYDFCTGDSRCMINGEFHTVHFVEDVSYQMLLWRIHDLPEETGNRIRGQLCMLAGRKKTSLLCVFLTEWDQEWMHAGKVRL